MSERHRFLAEEAGERLDVFLVQRLENITRSLVQKWIEEGQILVNGAPRSKNYKLRQGDMVEVEIPHTEPLQVEAQNIPLDIFYEDAHLLVVNKPKGMVVHPAAGNWDGTLVNALLYHCKDSLSGINGVIRPGIVHRIDKDTSGLLLVAKSNEAHLSLAKQLAEHSIKREYRAIVYGDLKEETGVIDAPIGRSEKDRLKMAVNPRTGKRAVTHYQVVERLSGFTCLALRLETGRTHQIRVHMASAGHPLAGDPVYGPKKVIRELDGQCLHAKILGFVHPVTGEYMEFDSPLPDYFTAFLQKHRGGEIS